MKQNDSLIEQIFNYFIELKFLFNLTFYLTA